MDFPPASIFSVSVTKYGDKYPLSNCIPQLLLQLFQFLLASSTVITPSFFLPYPLPSAISFPIELSLLAENRCNLLNFFRIFTYCFRYFMQLGNNFSEYRFVYPLLNPLIWHPISATFFKTLRYNCFVPKLLQSLFHHPHHQQFLEAIFNI